MIRKSFPSAYKVDFVTAVLGLKDRFLISSLNQYFICDHFGNINLTTLKYKNSEFLYESPISNFGFDSFCKTNLIFSINSRPPFIIDDDGFVDEESNLPSSQFKRSRFIGFCRNVNYLCFSKMTELLALSMPMNLIEQLEQSKYNFHIVNLKTMNMVDYDLPIEPMRMAITSNEMTIFVCNEYEYLIMDLDQ